MKAVLSIAGSDSSGGAGAQGDLRTIAAHGLHGLSVVTAITAQSGDGVRGWWPVSGAAVAAQLHAALELGPAAVKVGMLGDAEAARAVCAALSTYGGPIIVDPVARSSSGATLLNDDALALLRDELLPMSTLVTPNLAEAEALTGVAVTDRATQRVAAERVVALGAKAALVKGGHLEGAPVDVLYDGSDWHELPGDRVSTEHTHGTGCALASAIACGLSTGAGLLDSVAAAKAWVAQAIAGGYPLGGAPGPIDHLWQQRTSAAQDSAP